MFHRLLQYRLRSILICMAIAALFVCFVLEPECRRTRTISRLFSLNAIQPPVVIMFGGQPSSPAKPIPEPKWFSIRQAMANSLGLTTMPWYGGCRLDLSSSEAEIERLAKSCWDLNLVLERSQETRDNNVMHAKPGLRAVFSACKIIVPAR